MNLQIGVALLAVIFWPLLKQKNGKIPIHSIQRWHTNNLPKAQTEIDFKSQNVNILMFGAVRKSCPKQGFTLEKIC